MKNYSVCGAHMFVGTARLHMLLERKHILVVQLLGDPFQAQISNTTCHPKTDHIFTYLSHQSDAL